MSFDSYLGYLPCAKESMFPPPDFADSDGFLSISRELNIELLLDAYSHGIFPWFKESGFYCWFSPPKRAILYHKNFKLSRSFKKTLKRNSFSVSADRAFVEVMNSCALVKRKEQKGSWIEGGFIENYTKLHKAGFAHSLEVWEGDSLVGGLYGVSLGKMFVGESMFSKRSETSKIALYNLSCFLHTQGFLFVDAQIQNPHLETLGVIEVEREIFLQQLEAALKGETFEGSWSEEFEKYRRRY